MSAKNVTFVVTTAGAGNHMMRELFVALGFKHLGANPMNMWPIYVKAETLPDEPCSERLTNGITGLTNLEALSKMYSSWGYHPNPEELRSEDFAKKFFREVISERIEDERLLMIYNLWYSQVERLDDDPTKFDWVQAESDRAFRLLVESLENAPVKVKYIAMVRHPLALYLSKMERSHGTDQHDVRIEQMTSYFHRVSSIKANRQLDRLILKYEDLCGEADRRVREIVGWTFPEGEPEHLEKISGHARSLLRPPSKLHPRGKVFGEETELRNLAETYEYAWKNNTNPIINLGGDVARCVNDMTLLAQAMSGRIYSQSAYRRHHFSFPARATIRFMNYIPALRRRWNRLNDESLHNLGTGAEAPSGWGDEVSS